MWIEHKDCLHLFWLWFNSTPGEDVPYLFCLLHAEEQLSRIELQSCVAQSDKNLFKLIQMIIMAAMCNDQKVVNVRPHVLQSSRWTQLHQTP